MTDRPTCPDWWEADVAAVREFFGKPESAREALRESIKVFTENGNSFDARAKGAVATLFVLIGAAGFVVLGGPKIASGGVPPAGSQGLAYIVAGVILLGTCAWAWFAHGLLTASYSFYVASAIDSAKKHDAFGVANHMWHRYVFEELARDPADENELIDFWMARSNTLHSNYTRWLYLVAVASVIGAVACFVAAARLPG